MTCPRFSGLLALILGLIVLDAGRGQEPPADLKKKAQTEASSADRRIADLEALIGKLTKEVQSLRAELKAPAANLRPRARMDVNVFTLKHANAKRVAQALRDLFPQRDGLTIRVACEPSLSILLVRGSQTELEVVEALINRLEDAAQERKGK
jgi:Skp family chaperone for outer membrane proteins